MHISQLVIRSSLVAGIGTGQIYCRVVRCPFVVLSGYTVMLDFVLGRMPLNLKPSAPHP